MGYSLRSNQMSWHEWSRTVVESVAPHEQSAASLSGRAEELSGTDPRTSARAGDASAAIPADCTVA